MPGARPDKRGARVRLRRGVAHSRADSRAQPHSGPTRGHIDDRLLAPLRQHRLWTTLGVLVALTAALTRFVAIGILPPSIKTKPFAHATASTQVVVGKTATFTYSVLDHYSAIYSSRSYALADMVASPEVAGYVARAAGLPASKIGILQPLWTDLWQQQEWPSGPKRASEIVVENDPYHITLSTEANAPPWSPVIDVATQAPTAAAAARLASGVATGLNAYVLHLATTTGVPVRDRYQITQLGAVSISPARKSQLASVALFTFIAVLVLWCGGEVAVSALMRDLRARALLAKAGDGLERSSDRRTLLMGTD